MSLLPDIRTEADIKKLVDAFYLKVLADPQISYLFTEVVALSWEAHIPIMYDFWSSILLGTSSYAGNPMVKHIELDKKEHLLPNHFAQWLLLWEQTLKENFRGYKAEEALVRAKNIAGIMQFKVEQHRTI